MNKNRDLVRSKAIEEDIAWFIGYNMGRTVVNMPDEFSAFDFIIAKNKNGLHIASALVEFRHRPDVNVGDYKTIVINKSKIDKIREMASTLKIPAIMLVLWKDTGVMWCKLRGEFPVNGEFTRNDPQRKNDRAEPVYEIPITNFQLYMEYTVRP